MKLQNKYVLIIFLFLFVGTFFWVSRQTRVNNAVSSLAAIYKLESQCFSKEALEYPIESFGDAIADPECIKNTTQFAKLQGFDLERLSPEKNCKCLKLNLDKVLEKYGTANDQCLLIQTKNFVTNRCKELAARENPSIKK